MANKWYWEINPNTGDYVIEDGSPKLTDALTMAAYVRLKTKRGQWLYAPDNDYGSDFYLQKKRRTNQDQTFIENVGARALAPMLNDGRAGLIDVDAVQASRHGIGLSVKILDARTQQVQEIKLPSV